MDISEEQLLEHSFVVSVDDKRLTSFNKNFSDNGLKIPSHWNGAYLDREIYKHLEQNKINAIRLSMQELCNGLSHYFIVVMAKCMNWPFVTIFEDDAVPIKSIHEDLKFYLSNLPEDTDILRLGWSAIRNKIPKNRNAIHSNDKIEQKNIAGSHAYVVFKRYYSDFVFDSRIHPRADFQRINPMDNKQIYSVKKSLFNQVNIVGAPVMHSTKNGVQ